MQRPQSPQARPNQDMELLVPVNVAPLALIAGYVALGSMLCLPSPLALVLGVLALRDLASKPQCTGKGRAWFAVVSGGIGTALLLFVLVSEMLSAK